MSSSLSFLAATSSPFYSRHARRPALPAGPTRFRTFGNAGGGANASNTSRHANANTKGGGEESLLRLDRRNVLLGTLGGLTVVARDNVAAARPVQPPDLSKCGYADGGAGAEHIQCCPSFSPDMPVGDFKFPPPYTQLRVRKPAHLLDEEEIERYKEAYRRMKALDPSDPWSFEQQARVHCQYCNGAYDQLGFDNIPIQVHFSWIFLPWHRLYLHIHERILGKLLGDETFALPFWNWDTPDGMKIPTIFLDEHSPLYDTERNPENLYKVLDYKFSYKNTTTYSDEELKAKNLYGLNKMFREGLPLPELFMGDPIKAGEVPSTSTTMGSLERVHNAIHQFVGTAVAPHRDMGNFYSAGYDPLFYSHHSNVDRMWWIYRQKRANKTEFTNGDWFNSTFIFYDENKQLVKAKLKDAMNPLKLGYTYEEVELPWADRNIKKDLGRLVRASAKPRSTVSLVPVSEFGPYPRRLESTIRALVKRPKKSRSRSEKEEETEVLVVDGIEIYHNGPVTFDVYVALPLGGDFAGPDLGEDAGSFVKLQHSEGHHGSGNDRQRRKFLLKLGISNLLEDMNAEDAEKLVVNLVPRVGDVTIGGLHIDLIKTDFVA